MSDQTSTDIAQEESGSIDILGLLEEILNSKKAILYSTLATTSIAVVLAFVTPPKFTSTASILPGSQKSGGGANLAQLAALAGVSVGGSGEIMDAQLYPSIISSESVLKPVIYEKYWSTESSDSINLIKYYEIEEKTPEMDFETVIKIVRDQLNVSMDRKTNLISLGIATKEPALSAAIINSVVKEVDGFIKTKRQSSARSQRTFIEGRLAEISRDLKRTEDELKKFRENNRSTTSSPGLMLTQERLFREVTINNTLFIELKKQHELSKIEEVKDTPIITVVDSARPAALKSEPKRRNYVLIGFFLGLFGSIATVLGMSRIPQPVKDFSSKHFNALRKKS